MEVKEKIVKALQSTNREGIENLITYLTEKCDFFTAPASRQHHGNYEGGLAEHSWKVYELFSKKNKDFNLGLPEQSVIISAICHDLCKINFYTKGIKNVKDGKKINSYGKEVDNWIEKEIWEIDDQLPLGHGHKSVIILQGFIKVKKVEAMLITWHMGIPEDYKTRIIFSQAVEKYPSVVALHTSDFESAYLLETIKK